MEETKQMGQEYTRRSIATLGAAMVAAGQAQAQSSQHERVIVPFGPGGTSDILARLVVASINKTPGRTLIVENRAGGGGTIGADAVARSAPDGRTMLLMDIGGLAVAPNLFPNLSFNPETDLLPVTMLSFTPYVVAVHKDVPVRTAQELMAFARRSPDRLTASNSGAGALTHLTSLVLTKAWGAPNATQVPYRGSGPSIAAVVSGEVVMTASTIDVMKPFIESGAVRGLAVSGPNRLALLPDAPTFAELGWPMPEVGSWQGVLTQGRTPVATRDRLEAEFLTAMRDPTVVERVTSLGAVVRAQGSAHLRETLKAQTEEYGRIIRENGIRLE
ncbi:tripartite tricarboxylate transporter substrate binding protein [Roseomonas terrae]|jgi:tripartite-type tricarboxylate transporter receptor subunit TctC|uniref:Tripartite tricarboxylate transporter substrate binding protein n=1 Tax=Neoroseomonas terrae TaxID=424799 RepID=A0ABS5EBF2_9PROT|nr:tripartite tricarboxylate transporter substrate binding protein [Neoroseomonas terrae]MBR0648351.1 tripartite tricarboxylate transporter substrate binding protein [Neoroseomonas terrae]